MKFFLPRVPKKKIFKRMDLARKHKSQQSSQEAIQSIGIEEQEFKDALLSLPKLAHNFFNKKDTLTCKKTLKGIQFSLYIIKS